MSNETINIGENIGFGIKNGAVIVVESDDGKIIKATFWPPGEETKLSLTLHDIIKYNSNSSIVKFKIPEILGFSFSIDIAYLINLGVVK